MKKLTAALFALAVMVASVQAEDKPKAELPKPDAEGWITLYNGKDLTGWNGNPEIWRVVDGYISGKIDKIGYNTFLIYDHPFKDFVLEFKFILVDGKGNSGMQYRSKVHDPAKWIVGGYQADIGGGYYGSLYDEKARGKLLFTAPKDAAATIKGNEWNQFVVEANGSKVKHTLNGVACGEFDDQDPKWAQKEGILALQYHAPGNFEIRFKDIRIKLIEAK